MSAPQGLVYRPDFLAEDEETGLLAVFEGMAFEEVRMHGRAALRTVRHFGFDYDYEGRGLTPGEALPADLEWLRARCGELAGVSREELAQALVARYPPGSRHRLAP